MADSEDRAQMDRPGGEGRRSAGRPSDRDSRGEDGGDRRRSFRPRRGGPRRRNRVCQFCVEKAKSIDYKAASMLRQYINERGRILPRRRTAACAKHQRMLSQAIKRARHVALLPYTGEHVRAQG